RLYLYTATFSNENSKRVSPKKERIYYGKDGRRKALPILTYLALTRLVL
ncbi:MAG: hypothetical protein RLZZ139_858, partial [Cyanobacteriota bacterium]